MPVLLVVYGISQSTKRNDISETESELNKGNMPEWLKYLISFLIGGAGSLFAPWANWGIEKKKIRLQQRIDLLKKFKGCLNTLGLEACQDLPTEYAQLTRFIDKSLVTELAAFHKSGKSDYDRYHELKGRLVAEIARIEAKWGIV